LIASLARGVIPCAVQREAVRCRHGIFTGARICNPVSAQQHFMLQRARDDGEEPFNLNPAFGGARGS